MQACGPALGLLALHRLSREWNRGGDKWAHLPDIADWLLLFLLFPLALCSVTFP